MNILTYAASSGLLPQIYVDGAIELGSMAAQRGHTIINGAGRTGLMGAVTKGAMQAGGKAIGVIPKFMIEHGWQHTGMTELVITEDMHERKEQMASRSDAVIALPGGVGTMEELLEIITWKQLGLYLKPIVILNIDHYFDPLLQQMSKAIEQNFMRNFHNRLWNVAETPEEAITLCETTPMWDPGLTKYAAI
ncbi:MAG: TIGR00730 family Rossman fold protein [Bacteroidaceae bacterium]|nr:TIGR00730 family Rossman fold protein [Bacteroidaceae bacterium]